MEPRKHSKRDSDTEKQWQQTSTVADGDRSGRVSSAAEDSDDIFQDEKRKLLTKNLIDNEPEKKKYPRAVFFIIGNEFCERFSYYGMRTVLTIYLTHVLLYSDDVATMIYHGFTMGAYFTPIFGAFIADSWLGKYRTIFYISIIYAIGNITVAAGSIPHSLSAMSTACVIGLIIIAIGTGGIKPCVSAFGGDQFEVGQEKQLKRFFSLFYLAINTGSVLSTFLTPVLREDVHCFNQKSCFPLAFGVPAVLMIVSLILFLLGKPLYKIVPSKGNVVVTVFQCISHAIVKKSTATEKKRDHWLDYADDKYDATFICDVKTVLHVLFLYLPLPVFWALFDQQGSRWTLQATRMDGEINGYHIKPDQLQVVNPFLIIMFIPLFDYIVYPLLAKCHLLRKPLQRIATGGLLAALSFVVAGLVEISLESTYPIPPAPGMSDLIIINNSPCKININDASIQSLDPFEKKMLTNRPFGKEQSWTFTPENCSIANDAVTETFNATNIVESMMITVENNKLKFLKVADSRDKPETGDPKVRIFYNTDYDFSEQQNSTFKFLMNGDIYLMFPNILEDSNIGTTKYYDLLPGLYSIYIPLNETAHETPPIGKMKAKAGGTYIVSIYKNPIHSKVEIHVFTVVEPNTIHILHQVPQYVIITAGEIMFSITGLEFSYSQAPVSMKSVLQAAWLLTVAFGNLIVVIIAKLSLFEKRSYELFMFAALMGLDMLIFAVMAYFYKYVNVAQSDSKDSPPKKGQNNQGFIEETNFTK